MDRYAVVGHPISHSKSPFIHTLFAKQTQQAMSYEALDLPENDFTGSLGHLFAHGMRGCNVTVPFKEEAYDFATQLTERAKLAGSVNTLKVTDDGLILGDNTDGAGLLADLKMSYGPLDDQRILLLGAGGAARGVLGPLLKANPASLIIANRTEAKADELVKRFREYGSVDSQAIHQLTGSFDLIINATSASLSGDSLELPTAIIDHQVSCYDMMYMSGLTPFNQWAKQHGARQVLDGLGMLVAQAAESFAIWRGIRPGLRSVMNELRRNMKI